MNSTRPARFPREYRLGDAAVYRRVLRSAPVERAQHVEAYARPNGLTHARLGIVIARKTAPRSVDRSGCKRQIREVFRLMQGGLKGLDVVVRLRAPWARKPAVEIRTEVLSVLTGVAQCRGSLSR